MTHIEALSAIRTSHTAPGPSMSDTVLLSSDATQQRADWMSVPLGALTPLTAPADQSDVTGASNQAWRERQPRKPLDAEGVSDLERRLETLKRLRDRALITNDEYQQKRKEILQQL
jgi:hypothetical protein